MKNILLLLLLAVAASCAKNEPPTCSIITPEENALFFYGDSIAMSVEAEDADGTVSGVRLYLDDIGLLELASWPYNAVITTTGVEPGYHLLKAIATDDALARTVDSVRISLGAHIQVTTGNAGNIGIETASLSASLSNPGNIEISDAGFYLSREPDPANTGAVLTGTVTNGTIFLSLDTLSEYTTYYYAAYAESTYEFVTGETKMFSSKMDSVAYFSDLDGNTFKAVFINDRWWMAENLRTQHFNDGIEIPIVTDTQAWSELETPAACWYMNDSGTYRDYGLYYNGYAVDAGNLCPEGWHVSTVKDWEALESFLGMPAWEIDDLNWRGTNEGGMLKETGTEHWDSPNVGATDAYGFSGLPGGFRRNDGSFDFEGMLLYLWTEKHHVSNEIYRRSLRNDYTGINNSAYFVKGGLNVRCVKDDVW